MKVTYACIYADSDGESHFKDVEVELQETNYAPPAMPLHVSSFIPAAECCFITMPPDWYGDWHPAPRRQFVIHLTGQIETRASDGETRTFGPGDILLMEDRSGKGHISRAVGSAEVRNAVVRLPG
jgi:hypothetical protein